MDRSDVLEVLRTQGKALLDLDPARITEETSLRDDLEVDSLDLVEYTMAVEDELGLSDVDESVYADDKTIGDFVTTLLAQVSAQSA